MDLRELTFLNETNFNFHFNKNNENNENNENNVNNENQTSSVIIIMGIGILFTYSIINFILGNPKKILEDIKEKEIREYKKKYYDELSLLENKDYSDEELKQLTNKILKEDTSYGVVHMFYNVDNVTFNYYCDDKNISYIFLDAIARKYAITYDCKCICVNFREEWKKAKKIAYEEQEKKEAQEKEGQEKNNEKKSIFAQYKSYEKTPRVTNNRKNTKGDNDIDDYDSDDSSRDIGGDSKGINKQLVEIKKSKSSIKRRRFNINVKQTNRFTYKGNLNDYKDLEFKNQITKDVTNVKNNLSFKDFKKKIK
jgi:hypothetical protein